MRVIPYFEKVGESWRKLEKVFEKLEKVGESQRRFGDSWSKFGEGSRKPKKVWTVPPAPAPVM